MTWNQILDKHVSPWMNKLLGSDIKNYIYFTCVFLDFLFFYFCFCECELEIIISVVCVCVWNGVWNNIMFLHILNLLYFILFLWMWVRDIICFGTVFAYHVFWHWFMFFCFFNTNVSYNFVFIIYRICTERFLCVVYDYLIYLLCFTTFYYIFIICEY